MTIKRALTFDDYRAIEEFLLLDSGETTALFMGRLFNALQAAPERVACFQAWSDDGELKAFILAQLEDPNGVWISQGWSHADNPWEVANALVDRIRLWAVALGRTWIQARTKRATRAMFERFGFVEVARVVEIKIDSQTAERVYAAVKEPK